MSVDDTPRRAHLGDQADTALKHMEDYRTIHIKDIGTHVPRVTLTFFKDSVLPSLTAEEVADIRKDLVKKRVINSRKGETTWAGFSTTPKKSEKKHESAVYQPMVEIHKAIVDSAKTTVARFKHTKQTVMFESKQNPTYDSEIENADFRSDAAGVCCETTGIGSGEKTKECDVVYPCEWKKNRSLTDVNDVSLKNLSLKLLLKYYPEYEEDNRK